MTIDLELVLLHTLTPSMFDKISVHSWRFKPRTLYMGSLSIKLMLTCQEVLKWVWLSMNQTRILFIEIQTLPQACTTSGKKSLILYAKTPTENHRGPSPNRKSHWVKCHAKPERGYMMYRLLNLLFPDEVGNHRGVILYVHDHLRFSSYVCGYCYCNICR